MKVGTFELIPELNNKGTQVMEIELDGKKVLAEYIPREYLTEKKPEEDFILRILAKDERGVELQFRDWNNEGFLNAIIAARPDLEDIEKAQFHFIPSSEEIEKSKNQYGKEIECVRVGFNQGDDHLYFSTIGYGLKVQTCQNLRLLDHDKLDYIHKITEEIKKNYDYESKETLIGFIQKLLSGAKFEFNVFSDISAFGRDYKNIVLVNSQFWMLVLARYIEKKNN